MPIDVDSDKYAHLTPDYFRKEKPVLVLMKGGTIDAESYIHTDAYKTTGKPPEFVTALKYSAVPKAMAANLRPYCSFLQLKMDDSQKIVQDKKDMAAVAELIRNIDQPFIVMSLVPMAWRKWHES